VTDLAFRTACVTNIGLAREHNEDDVLVRPDIGLWAVADGMGGYGGGDIASGAVVTALKTLSPSSSAAHLLAEFEQRIIRVNADLRALAPTRGAILGTPRCRSSLTAGSCGRKRRWPGRDETW